MHCWLHTVENSHIRATSWTSQDQIEIGERAGGGQFEDLDAEILAQHFYDQSGGDHWSYI